MCPEIASSWGLTGYNLALLRLKPSKMMLPTLSFLFEAPTTATDSGLRSLSIFLKLTFTVLIAPGSRICYAPLISALFYREEGKKIRARNTVNS